MVGWTRLKSITVADATTIVGDSQQGRLPLPVTGFLTGITAFLTAGTTGPVFVAFYFNKTGLGGVHLGSGWARVDIGADPVFWNGRHALDINMQVDVTIRNDTGAAVGVFVAATGEQ